MSGQHIDQWTARDGYTYSVYVVGEMCIVEQVAGDGSVVESECITVEDTETIRRLRDALTKVVNQRRGITVDEAITQIVTQTPSDDVEGLI